MIPGVAALSALMLLSVAGCADADSAISARPAPAAELSSVDRASAPGGSAAKAVSAVDLYNEFTADISAATGKYTGKKIVVTGVVVYTGPDIHNTPSIELSTATGEKRYVVCVVNSYDQLKAVSPGDRVVVTGNFHIFSSADWGVVLKQGEVLKRN